MAKTKTKAKKRKPEIKKRKTTKVSKSIKKIKAHEKKYTFILVLFFILLFIIIGYFTLRIQTRITNGKTKEVVETHDLNYRIVSDGEVITLTDNDVLSDENGLNKDGYLFSYKNKSRDKIKYRIRLVKDNNMIKDCDCAGKTIDFQNLKYSIDGNKIEKFQNSDMVVAEGVLNNNTYNTINLKLWVDENFDKSNYHFHGHLEMEELA